MCQVNPINTSLHLSASLSFFYSSFCFHSEWTRLNTCLILLCYTHPLVNIYTTNVLFYFHSSLSKISWSTPWRMNTHKHKHNHIRRDCLELQKPHFTIVLFELLYYFAMAHKYGNHSVSWWSIIIQDWLPMNENSINNVGTQTHSRDECVCHSEFDWECL